jgi:ABC-type bacteriocin/lantibiotic exporter with double-glycine peptidase domain
VGELSTRIVEIDKIRQFFTSTALTTILDAVFSVMYIGVMLLYSTFLTAVALSTLPFFVLLSSIVSPLLRLLTIWQNFQETALSIERLSDIVDSPLEVEEENRFNIPMPLIQGKVVYEDITFQFTSHGRPQLNRINLTFEAGSFVGIVGQSGSGKSTLMKMLPRLYDPSQGRITIDNYDIGKVELYSLREQIGIVSQDPLLFEGTVQDNISINYPDATTEEIINAAKIAVAHDFIMSLPNGYNTRVGERGSNLSGGQKQRLAIARTILQRPRLLILDEATSALDYDTERQVCHNLVACKSVGRVRDR